MKSLPGTACDLDEFYPTVILLDPLGWGEGEIKIKLPQINLAGWIHLLNIDLVIEAGGSNDGGRREI